MRPGRSTERGTMGWEDTTDRRLPNLTQREATARDMPRRVTSPPISSHSFLPLSLTYCTSESSSNFVPMLSTAVLFHTTTRILTKGENHVPCLPDTLFSVPGPVPAGRYRLIEHPLPPATDLQCSTMHVAVMWNHEAADMDLAGSRRCILCVTRSA